MGFWGDIWGLTPFGDDSPKTLSPQETAERRARDNQSSGIIGG